mgnify:CR=1 FL=1
MAFQEVITPEIQVPVLKGVIKACAQVYILIELPGMDGTNHGRNGTFVFQMEGIAKILVIGKGIVCSLIDNPPSIRTPEQIPIIRDCPVHVESRCQVGELETVVQIEGRCHLCTNVIPFANIQTVSNQTSPIGTIRACV